MPLDSAFCVFYAVLGGLPAMLVLVCNITVIWELFRSKQRRVSVTNMIRPEHNKWHRRETSETIQRHSFENDGLNFCSLSIRVDSLHGKD